MKSRSMTSSLWPNDFALYLKDHGIIELDRYFGIMSQYDPTFYPKLNL